MSTDTDDDADQLQPYPPTWPQTEPEKYEHWTDAEWRQVDSLEHLAIRIWERRKHGLRRSRAQVAKDAGLAPTTLATLEKGYRSDGEVRKPPTTPTDATLMAIARGLELPAATVFEWAGRHYRPPEELDGASDRLSLDELERLLRQARDAVTDALEQVQRGRTGARFLSRPPGP